MNASTLSWQDLCPSELRCIEIDRNEIRLIFRNDSHLELEFADTGQLDTFVSQLLTSLVEQQLAESVMWN